MLIVMMPLCYWHSDPLLGAGAALAPPAETCYGTVARLSIVLLAGAKLAFSGRDMA